MAKSLIVCIAGVAVFALTGCYYTNIASPKQSSEEEAWEALIRESYSGYNPPPAVIRNDRKRPVVTPMADNNVKPADEVSAQDADAAAEPTALPVNEPQTSAAEQPAEAKVEDAKPAETAAPAETKVEDAKPAETAAPAEAKVEEAKVEEAKVDGSAPAAPATGVTPPDPTNSTVYEVKYGDTLGSIAQKTYGNARYSNVIFKANADILKDPNRLSPGMKLILPKL